MAARPTNRQLIDYLASTGTGVDKLNTIKTLIGQGNQRVPADAVACARAAGLPEITVRKMDRFLNPVVDAPEESKVDEDGYTRQTSDVSVGTSQVLQPATAVDASVPGGSDDDAPTA